MGRVKKGDVLVTDMTDPNWEPVMKLAAAIVTNRGGRTCHAAIIARGSASAVVGCGDATGRLKDGQPVTVSCAKAIPEMFRRPAPLRRASAVKCRASR